MREALYLRRRTGARREDRPALARATSGAEHGHGGRRPTTKGACRVLWDINSSHTQTPCNHEAKKSRKPRTKRRSDWRGSVQGTWTRLELAIIIGEKNKRINSIQKEWRKYVLVKSLFFHTKTQTHGNYERR